MEAPESNVNEKFMKTIVKSKNQNVVRLQKQRLKKKIEKLKANLHFIGQTSGSSKTWDLFNNEKEFTKLGKSKKISKKNNNDVYNKSVIRNRKVNSYKYII